VDFLFDYISVGSFWTTLLIAHGLCAVALLGALTHQAMAVLAPVKPGTDAEKFLTRFRAVSGPRYASAVCVLWIVTFIFGAWIYSKYRIQVRIPIEQLGYWKTLGIFELKEHLVSFGMGALPIYWYLWRNAARRDYDGPRKWLTAWLAAVCWFAFLVGHIVNNARGYAT
jgi:hypothetical protein